MRSLSDTLARLNAMKTSADRAARQTQPSRLAPFPPAGRNEGRLNAKIYVPAGIAAGSALIVALHGCTQDADAFDVGSGWSQLADEQSFVVLYPEQQRANNANLCFNWFNAADTTRGAGEAASIHALIEATIARHNVNRSRIFITGLSAGGAMAASMLACYPDVFAGGAIIAGLAHGVAQSVPEAFDRMRGHGLPSEAQLQALISARSTHQGQWPSVSIWHGDADRTVAVANAGALVAQWRGPHRVPETPTRIERGDRHIRRSWDGANGSVAIEEIVIAGMGHGLPLRGGDAVGRIGPFMLDAGISSTREIARSWGLTKASASRTVVAKSPATSAPIASSPAMPRDAEPVAPAGSAQRPTPSASSPLASSVTNTIESALRAAGLMR
ncbi:esterase PHB depolymerase [Variibacter gotjawalensis]|uniref:Esterase PHB depolymerase n=1 Tax=Variibacter gotjawalensis TaxID=1333996 RepID=A0A0S3PU87_9BRAD|nr:PHB depolymerase family esterase [Variibacter gotjawalensis]NIK49862.1 poly(hydroxyalkanoate) depolymerase family esterase [Variibacter gotjawalensis]RZS45861.1 poly(hydroxyalkanoate) depolymerase family esterase [Variibacter gotjawalensis]BAT59537.1 esterase PHB depolymerase [Variibacter gotjawalensis]